MGPEGAGLLTSVPRASLERAWPAQERAGVRRRGSYLLLLPWGAGLGGGGGFYWWFVSWQDVG